MWHAVFFSKHHLLDKIGYDQTDQSYFDDDRDHRSVEGGQEKGLEDVGVFFRHVNLGAG